jgi:hypothetical protein
VSDPYYSPEALKRECDECGARIGEPCTDTHGAPTIPHFMRSEHEQREHARRE